MTIAIDGMHCQACVRRVQKALESVPGARVEKVDIGSAVIDIGAASEGAVLEAVRKAGYEPQKAA
jgi:copper chaperone CopZ